MTKQLRTLAAFPQDLGSILRKNTVAQSNLYLSLFPRHLTPSSGLWGRQGMKNTHACKTNKQINVQN